MCKVRFQAEVVGLAQTEDEAQLTIHKAGEERTLPAKFVVRCGGPGSFVRGALGLPFEGMTYSLRPVLADVRVEDERDALPWPRTRNAPGGLSFTIRNRPGLWRLIRLDRQGSTREEEVPEEEVRALSDELPTRTRRLFRTHRLASPVAGQEGWLDSRSPGRPPCPGAVSPGGSRGGRAARSRRPWGAQCGPRRLRPPLQHDVTASTGLSSQSPGRAPIARMGTGVREGIRKTAPQYFLEKLLTIELSGNILMV
jgi:hypothetical protein